MMINILNVNDVAELFGCSEKKAREVMNRPDFPLINLTGKHQVEESALQTYLQTRRTNQ